MTAGLHSGPTFPSLGIAALRRYPERVAFVHDGRDITYRQTLGAVSQIGRALAALGLGPGAGIVSLCGNIPEAVEVGLGASAIGCRTSSLHPLTSTADMAFILDDSDASAFIFHGEKFDAQAAEVAALTGGRARLLSIGPSAVGEDLLRLAGEQSAETLRPVPAEDDLAAITYSGGTTGQPKGVAQPHRCPATMAATCMPVWQLPTSDFIYLAATPISHAAIAFVLPAWINGGTVVLQPGFDPDGFCAAIERHHITTTFVVPTMLYVMQDLGVFDHHDLSSLTTVVYGASPMSPTRLGEALDRFGPIFVQLYGQAEAPAAVTALRKEEHDRRRPELMGSCGQPLPGVTVELHDDDDAEIGNGEVGEICVRGRLVSDGYWKRPDLTAETFRNGWLHTGDMARRDDEGFLYIVDRKKDMVISGGFNIFPKEIEDVLTAHPAVAMAAVIGVPDDRWGEAVKAVVVARPGATVDAVELIELVKTAKGAVAAPKSVDIVDALPLTGLGKPDKKALRSRYWSDQERQVH